jgi:hypothetical protein
LVHDDKKVGLFDGQFLELLFILGGFALEDDLHRLFGEPLVTFDLLLEGADLTKATTTVAEDSISTAKISPLRFFRLTFIFIL